MGYSSQPGQIGFGIQTGRGTPAPATRFARLRSGSLGGERSLLIPDPEIGGNRDIPGAYLGPVSFVGDLEFYPRAQMVALLAYGCLGLKASTSVAGPPVIGTHVLDPGDVCPWLSVEERISSGFESYQYTDAKINSFRLEAEANGFLMGSANVLALSQTSGFDAQTDPDWDTTPMMVGSQVLIEFNDLVLPSKSFNLEINNNIENDDFNLGSVFLADATEKRREIKMGLTYRPKDADLWRAAMYGSVTANTPQAGPAYEGNATITIATYETIGDVVDGTPYSIVIDIPHVVIAPFKISPSGDDVLQNDLELTIIRPDSASPLTITVTNDLPQVS